MRLTTKITYNYITPDNAENIDVLVCNKLGKLEDIEEDLGIDLITFFKILKAPIVFVKKHNTYYENDGFDISDNTLWVYNQDKLPMQDIVYLKDYGKTWALTKEELTDR